MLTTRFKVGYLAPHSAGFSTLVRLRVLLMFILVCPIMSKHRHSPASSSFSVHIRPARSSRKQRTLVTSEFEKIVFVLEPFRSTNFRGYYVAADSLCYRTCDFGGLM